MVSLRTIKVLNLAGGKMDGEQSKEKDVPINKTLGNPPGDSERWRWRLGRLKQDGSDSVGPSPPN